MYNLNAYHLVMLLLVLCLSNLLCLLGAYDLFSFFFSQVFSQACLGRLDAAILCKLGS